MRLRSPVLASVLLLGACPTSDGTTGATGPFDSQTGAAATVAPTTAEPPTSEPGTAATTSGSTTGPTGTATSEPATSGATTTTTATTGEPPPSLCAPPINLLEHGSLDGGMSGQAPVGWEVRQPGQPENCGGDHVFASGPAPGCDGGGITVDALGQWDCWAVQTVSPYNSITGGATYRIQAAVRSEGNAVNPAGWFVLGAQWLDENDAFFGDEKHPKPLDPADNDYDWKLLSWDLVAPPNARRILVWMTAHYPGKVEFDHVAVYPL